MVLKKREIVLEVRVERNEGTVSAPVELLCEDGPLLWRKILPFPKQFSGGGWRCVGVDRMVGPSCDEFIDPSQLCSLCTEVGKGVLPGGVG